MALTKVTGHVVLPTTNIEFHNTKSTGIVTFTQTTQSTSTTTGALQIAGGVGIAKNLNVGGNLNVTGNLTYTDVDNINSVGIITANAGIVLQDYIFHKGDTNTSIGFPAADTIDLGTSGSPRIRIVSDGKIGINTTDASHQLTVFAKTANSTIARFKALNRNSNFDIVTDASSHGQAYVRNNIGAIKVALNSNGDSYFTGGDVGIGTASPASKFHVDGGNLTIRNGTAAGVILSEETGVGGSLKVTTAGGTASFGPGNTSYCHIMTDRGAFYFSKQVVVDQGIIGSYDEDLQLHSPINTRRVTINKDTGNVGIGTETPGDILHLRSTAPIIKVDATNNQSGLRIDVLGQTGGSNNQLFRVLRDSITKFQINDDGDVVITGDDNSELKLKAGTTTGNNIIAFLNSSGTTKGNIFYDTDDNFMVFKTNGTASGNERLRITDTGTSIFKGAGGSVDQVKIESQGGGSGIFISNFQGVDAGDASSRLGVGKNDNALIFMNASGSQVQNFAIGTTDAVPLVFSTANTRRLTVDSGGRVQIGAFNNTGSNTKLVVGAGNNINTTCLINTGDVDVDALTLSNWDGSATTNKVHIHFDCSGIAGYDVGIPAATPAFQIRNTSGGGGIFHIATDGKIGINIDNPRVGLHIDETSLTPLNDGNTYYMPVGNWSTLFNNGNTLNNEHYWAGWIGGYHKSGCSVNISLAPNRGNVSAQQGMYISGEATGISSSDFTVGKIMGGSATGASTSAGNQRATKSELFRISNSGQITAVGGLTVQGSTGINISYSGADLTMNSAGGIFTGNGGNSTNPIVANVSDTNTGIFYPAADNISITTGGAERLRIDNNGEIQCRGAADNKGFAVYLDNTRRVAELIEHSSDGELRLYTGNNPPQLKTVITSYGSSYINSAGTNYFGIGTASPSKTCHIVSNNEHQLYVSSIDGGAGGSMKIYSPSYAYYCSENTAREWRWGSYGGAAFVMRDNTGTANVFEIDTAGRIKVPASTFYGTRATNSITSAQGVASGDIMYIRGGAATSNSAFDMFTIGNLGGNQSLHIEISFHHSGGGTHGSFMRADYGLNSYTNIDTFQSYSHNFGGGGGFSVTRPASGDFKVSYNGSSSFHQNFQLMARVWCGRNTPRNNMTLTDSSGGQHSFGCTALLNF